MDMDEAALADSPPWEPEQYSNDEEEKGENSPSRTNIDDFHSVLTPSADITTQNGYVNQNISKSGIEVSTMSQEVGGLRPSLSPPPSPLYEQFPRNEADLANDWENSQRLDNHGIEDVVAMADSPPWEPDEEEMSTNESTNAASLGMTQRLDSPVLPSSPCLPTHEYDIENHTNDQMDVAIMTDSPPWEPEEMEIPAKNQVPMETSQPEESAAIDQNEKAEESNEVIIEQDTQAIEMEEDGKEPIQQVPGLDETQNLPTQLTTHESEHTDALQPHEAVGAPDEHDLPRSSNTSEESSPPISPENAEEFLTADDNMPKNERRTRFLETSEVIEVERIGTANYAKTQELKKGQGSSGGISKANTEDEDSFDYDNDASMLDMSIESFIASQHRESSSSSTSHKKRLSVSGTPRFPEGFRQKIISILTTHEKFGRKNSMSAPTLAQQYAAIYDQSIKEAFRTLDKSKKWWEYLRYVRGVKCVYKNEEKKDAEAKNLLFYLPLASTSPKEIEDRIISILSKVDALEGISTSKLIAEYKRLYDGMVTLELKKHTEEKFDRFVASLPGVLTHYETKSDGQVEKQFSLPPMTTTSNSHMSSSSNDFNDDASITDHTDNNSFDGYDPFDHEVTTIENTMLNRTVSSSYALSGTSSRQSPDFISHGIDESYNADYNQKANSNSTFIEAAEDGSTTSVSMSDIPMSMKLQRGNVSVYPPASTFDQQSPYENYSQQHDLGSSFPPLSPQPSMHSTADLSAQPGSVSSMTTTQTNLRRSSLPEDSQMTTTTVVKSRKRVKSEFQKLFHTLQKYPADVVLQYQMKEFIYDHMELLNENMILSVLNLCETIPENIVEGTKSYQSQISIDDVMDIQLVCLELQAITEPWTDEKAMEYFTILKKFNPMQCPHHVCILAVLINRIRATLLHQLPDSDLPLPNTTITVVGSVNPPDPSFYWFTTNTFVEFFLRIRLFPYDIQLQTLLELMAEKMKETLTIRPIPHLYNAIHDEHTGIKTNVYIYQLSIIQPLTIPQYAKILHSFRGYENFTKEISVIIEMTNAKFNFINNLTSPFGSHEIKHISKGLIKLMQGFIRVNPQYNVAKKAAATTSSTSNTASTTTSTSTDSPPSNDEAPQYIGGRIEILLDIYDLLAVKINELISIASTDEDVVINILQGIKQYPLDDIRLRHVIHALAKYGLGLDRITHERIVDSLLQFVVASLPKYTIEHEEIHAFFFLLAKLLRLAYEHVVIPLLMKNPSEAKYYLQFRAKKYGFESTEIRYALRNLSSSSNAIRSFVVALIPWMKYSILDDEHTEQCIVSSSKMNADGDDDDNEKEKENPEKHQVNLKIEQVIKSYTGLCKIREGSKLQFASAFPNNTMDQLSILLAFESEMISLMQVPFVQFFDTKDILELDFNQRVQAKQNQSQSSYDILLDFGTQSPYVQASSSSHLLLDSTTATSSSSSGGNDSMEVAKTQVQSMMRHIVPLLHAISKCMSHHEEIDAITLFLLHQLNTILSKETSILDEDHIFYDDWYDEEQNHRDEDDEEDRKCQEIYYYKSMNSGDRDLTLYHISACFAKWLLYCELLYNAGKIQSWYSTASREFLKLICKKLTTLLPQIMNYLLHARKQDGRRLTEKVYHVYLRSIAMVTIALEKISIIGDDVRPVMDFIYNTLFDEFFTMIDFIREEYTLTTSILQVSTHILRGFQRAQYYYTLDSMMTSHKTVFMRLVSQYVKIVDHAFHPELAAAEEEQQQQQAAQNELPALPHTPHASGSNRLGAYAPPSEDFMQAINAKFHKPEPPKKKEIISIEQAIQLLMKFVQNLSFKQWISCAELYMTPLESHQTCTEGGFNSISMKLQENCQSYNEVIITALSEGSNPFVLLFSISEVVLSMATIFTVFAFNNLTSLSSLKEVEDKINIYAVVDLLRIQCQKLYLTYDSFFKQSTTIYQDILEVMRKGVPSRSAYHALLDDLKQWKLKRMKDKQTAKAIAAQNPGAPQISATDEKDMEDKIFGEQAINVLYNFRPHLYFLSVINDIFGLRYQTPVPTQYDEEGNEISPAEPIAGEEILYPFYVDTRNMLTVVLIFVLIDIDSISLTSTIKLMRVCRAILDFAHSLQQRISRDDFAFDRADIICFMMEDILKKSIHHLETLYMKFVQRNLLPNANNAMNSSITSLPNTSSGQPSDLIQELFTSEIRELYQESIFYLQHYYQIVYYSDPNYNQAYSALSGNYFQTEIDSLQVIHDSLFSMIYQVPQISTFEKLRYSKRQDCIMTRPKMTGVDGNAVSATSPWYHMMEQALLQVMKISLYEINAFAWNSLVSYVIVNSFPALIRLEFSKQTVTKELYAISEDVRIVQGMHCLTLYHDFFGRIMIFSKEIQEGYHRLKTAKGNTTDAVEILDDDDDVMENLGSAKNANKIISSSSSSSNSCSSSSIEEKLQLKAKKFLQTTAYHLLMDVIPSHEYQPSTIFNTVIDSERIAESFGIIHVVFIVDVDNFSVWGRTERQAADSQEALLERFFATALESMNMMTLRFLGLIP